MENNEIEKAKKFNLVEIIEFAPNSVVSKTILNKTAGTVSAVSCDTGKALPEKIIPFDNFIQIIDGKAEIIIDRTSNLLEAGQSIIIPAHTKNIVKASERLKIISTIIKSGYE